MPAGAGKLEGRTVKTGSLRVVWIVMAVIAGVAVRLSLVIQGHILNMVWRRSRA